MNNGLTIQEERCPCCGQIVCDYEDDDFERDPEEEWREEQERRLEEKCEYAASCTCGAWIFNRKGDPIHVADCVCGNGF